MKKIILAILVALQPLMAMAEQTPQAIWTEGNTTLTFINDETVYAPGDSYNGETVTNVWSGTQVTNYNAYPDWRNTIKEKVTSVVFDESFQDVRPQIASHWFLENNVLTSITGLEYLNTSMVTNMQRMFEGCNLLTTIDVTHFDTSNVTSMYKMFYGCSVLEELDLSNFNTSKVNNMMEMFAWCRALKKVDLSNFDTSKITSMLRMFMSCSSLESLDVSSFNTSNVESLYQTFNDCSTLKTLDLSNFDTSKVRTLHYTFSGCSSLENLDISSFNTSKVASMQGTFNRCKALPRLDVRHFDTSSCTSMRKMFSDCLFDEIDVTLFNTANVTDMVEMFDGCKNLQMLDVSNFDTSSATNMLGMFKSCNQLTELDVSNFDTSKVTNMSYMFAYCNGLTSLDVSNFNTENVTNMEAMFLGCSKLPSLDVSNFNTEKVSNMRQMFYYCSSLKELEVRNFNTEKVDRMAGMFYNCNQLYYLDLTGFDFSRADNILNFLDKTDTVYVYVPSDIPATTLDKITGTKTNNLIIGDSENGFTCVDCRFYDGNRDLRLPYPFMANAITYFRTIAKGGNGNTIMLPCDFDVPTGMKAYRMKGSTGQVTDDIIYFQEMAAGEPMLANTPYLIANWGNLALPQLRMNRAVQVDNTIDYYDLEGTTQLTSYDGTETVETTLKDGTHVTMSGTFRTMPNSEVADQGIYIFQTGNKWKQVKSSNTSAYIRPYRAYLTKTGGGPSGVSLFNSVLMADTDDTTSVEELHLSSPNDGSVQYDLSGRRVTGPRKGIRVTKGKKVSTTKLSL